MTTLSFSTMWAQQERFEDDLARFRSVVAAFGYDAIEVSHSTDDAGLDAAHGRRRDPPDLACTPRRRGASSPTVASTATPTSRRWTRTSAALAVEETRRTIDFAARGRPAPRSSCTSAASATT